MASSARRDASDWAPAAGWADEEQRKRAAPYLAEIRAKLAAKAGPLPRRTRARAIDLELPTVDPDVIARRQEAKAAALEHASRVLKVTLPSVDPDSGEILGEKE